MQIITCRMKTLTMDLSLRQQRQHVQQKRQLKHHLPHHITSSLIPEKRVRVGFHECVFFVENLTQTFLAILNWFIKTQRKFNSC